jgi:hypothetical protein
MVLLTPGQIIFADLTRGRFFESLLETTALCRGIEPLRFAPSALSDQLSAKIKVLKAVAEG